MAPLKFLEAHLHSSSAHQQGQPRQLQQLVKDTMAEVQTATEAQPADVTAVGAQAEVQPADVTEAVTQAEGHAQPANLTAVVAQAQAQPADVAEAVTQAEAGLADRLAGEATTTLAAEGATAMVPVAGPAAATSQPAATAPDAPTSADMAIELLYWAASLHAFWNKLMADCDTRSEQGAGLADVRAFGLRTRQVRQGRCGSSQTTMMTHQWKLQHHWPGCAHVPRD